MSKSREGPNKKAENTVQRVSGQSKGDRVDRPLPTQHTGDVEQRQALSPKVHAHDGRVVGEVTGEVFYKDVKRSEHLLVSPFGWSFDICSLNEAEHKGAKSVQVHDRESGHKWCVSISDIRRYGMRIDRGRGIQLVLVLERFRHLVPGPARTLTQIDCDEQKPAVQLGMFESALGFGAVA